MERIYTASGRVYAAMVVLAGTTYGAAIGAAVRFFF